MHTPVRLALLLGSFVLAGAALAGPLDEARQQLEAGEFEAVDKALAPLLREAQPPPEALLLSARANRARGLLITASRRIDELLDITKAASAAQVLLGADLAFTINEHDKALERYRVYLTQFADEADPAELIRARDRLFKHGVYPDTYLAVLKRAEPDHSLWQQGYWQLRNLERAYEGEKMVQVAKALLGTFREPRYGNGVLGRLRHAAGDGVIDRRTAVATMAGHRYSDWNAMEDLLRHIHWDPEHALIALKALGRPVGEHHLRELRRLSKEKDAQKRRALAAAYLELAPIYRDSDHRHHYRHYLERLANEQNVFGGYEGEDPVDTARATELLAPLLEMFAEQPGQIRGIADRFLEHFVADEQKQAFARQFAPAIHPERLRAVFGDDAAAARELRAVYPKPDWFDYYFFDVYDKPEEAERVVGEVRGHLWQRPGSFAAADLGRRFFTHSVVDAAAKVKLLQDFYRAAGYSRRLQQFADEAAKVKALQEHEGFQAFREALAEKRAGEDALMVLHGRLAATTRGTTSGRCCRSSGRPMARTSRPATMRCAIA